MPAPIQYYSARLEKLAQKAHQTRTVFQNAYPDLYLQLHQRSHHDAQQHQQPAQQSPSQNNAEDSLQVGMAQQISQEEYTMVIAKLAAITQLPPGKMDVETALYIEQQVADLLGIQVATRLHDNELLHTYGTIKALPHLKRSPTDMLSVHQYSRAPYAGRRGYFGWTEKSHSNLTEDQDPEKYYVALPFHLFPSWNSAATTIKQWYALRKVLVINPHEQIAVVCRVVDAFTHTNPKYQFGGSPEVIIEGRCWSPRTLGKVLLFFLVDETDSIPLGPIYFAQKD